MKKLLFLLAIIPFFLLSCGESESRKKARQNQNPASIEKKDTSTYSVENPKPETVSPDTVSFKPADIAVSKVLENPKDSCGESQYSCHTFQVGMYFIDSSENYYRIDIYESTSNDENYEGSGLAKAKKLYQLVTDPEVKPNQFLVTFDGKNLTIGRNEPVIKKKIGNAILLEEKPEPLWTGQCQKYSKEKMVGLY